MKYYFDISDVPGQSFTTELHNHSVEISIKSCRGILVADVSIDGELRSAGKKCMPNASILSHDDEVALGGKIYLTSFGDEYPSYEELGKNCILTYEEF